MNQRNRNASSLKVREEIENQVQRRNQLWINTVFLSLHVIVGVGATMFLVRPFV
jgi:hypothetical protein